MIAVAKISFYFTEWIVRLRNIIFTFDHFLLNPYNIYSFALVMIYSTIFIENNTKGTGIFVFERINQSLINTEHLSECKKALLFRQVLNGYPCFIYLSHIRDNIKCLCFHSYRYRSLAFFWWLSLFIYMMNVSIYPLYQARSSWNSHSSTNTAYENGLFQDYASLIRNYLWRKHQLDRRLTLGVLLSQEKHSVKSINQPYSQFTFCLRFSLRCSQWIFVHSLD